MRQVCPAPVSSLGEAVTQWCSGLSLGHCSLSLSVFPLMAQRADWVLFCLLSFCHPPVQCGLPEEEICLLVGGRANLISVEEPP